MFGVVQSCHNLHEHTQGHGTSIHNVCWEGGAAVRAYTTYAGREGPRYEHTQRMLGREGPRYEHTQRMLGREGPRYKHTQRMLGGRGRGTSIHNVCWEGGAAVRVYTTYAGKGGAAVRAYTTYAGREGPRYEHTQRMLGGRGRGTSIHNVCWKGGAAVRAYTTYAGREGQWYEYTQRMLEGRGRGTSIHNVCWEGEAAVRFSEMTFIVHCYFENWSKKCCL